MSDSAKRKAASEVVCRADDALVLRPKVGASSDKQQQSDTNNTFAACFLLLPSDVWLLVLGKLPVRRLRLWHTWQTCRAFSVYFALLAHRQRQLYAAGLEFVSRLLAICYIPTLAPEASSCSVNFAKVIKDDSGRGTCAADSICRFAVQFVLPLSSSANVTETPPKGNFLIHFPNGRSKTIPVYCVCLSSQDYSPYWTAAKRGIAAQACLAEYVFPRCTYIWGWSPSRICPVPTVFGATPEWDVTTKQESTKAFRRAHKQDRLQLYPGKHNWKNPEMLGGSWGLSTTDHPKLVSDGRPGANNNTYDIATSCPVKVCVCERLGRQLCWAQDGAHVDRPWLGEAVWKLVLARSKQTCPHYHQMALDSTKGTWCVKCKRLVCKEACSLYTSSVGTFICRECFDYKCTSCGNELDSNDLWNWDEGEQKELMLTTCRSCTTVHLLQNSSTHVTDISSSHDVETDAPME